METIGFVGLGHMGGNMACVSARLPDSPERRQVGRTVVAFLALPPRFRRDLRAIRAHFGLSRRGEPPRG